MTGSTELADVQALLDRVRPDPTGFAQRLLVQVITQWGDLRETNSAKAYIDIEEDAFSDGRGTNSSASASPDEPVDISMLVAAALGACQCWGLRTDCDICGGQGSTGWIMPDRELFEALVEPAIVKMSARPEDPGHNQQVTERAIERRAEQ
jgi:hypothetical protein